MMSGQDMLNRSEKDPPRRSERSFGRLRGLVKKNYPLACGYYLLNNARAAVTFKAGRIESSSGMAHADKDLAASLSYIHEVFGDYKQYSGVERFHGRAAEIGPGDNCGVGLLFLRDGCGSVDLLDRFYTKRDPRRQAGIYQALIGKDDILRERYGHLAQFEDDAFDGITRFYGDEAAAETFFLTHKGYDLIVSRAVLEHVYDPSTAVARMAEALSPGGMMLHKVDLRDHGMFSTDFHELKFYEIPDRLYPLMTKAAGYPNRVLMGRYKDVARKACLEHTFLVTRLAGVGDITPHLPYQEISGPLRAESLRYVRSVKKRFTGSLAALPDEELSITGFFLIAKKNMAMKRANT